MYKINKLVPVAMLVLFSVALAQPTLITPPNGSVVYEQTPIFDWSDEGGANTYRIQIDDTIDFASPAINTTVAISEFQPAPGELPETLYYWRVQVEDPGPGLWSDVWTVTIQTKGPDLIAPPLNAVINDTMPEFMWFSLLGASRYWLQVLPVDSSTPIINDSTITDTTFACLPALWEGQFNWGVVAQDSYGIWSQASISSFIIDLTPPAVPSLLLPGNSSTIYDQTPTFSWNAVDSAVLYNLVVDNGLKTEVINIETAETEYTPLSNLDVGTYSWQVRAKDAAGNWSEFSSAWTFTISSAAPGWAFRDSLPSGGAPKKYVKAGGALVAVAGISDDGNALYAFRGNKSKEFYTYDPNANDWTIKESIPFGPKPAKPTKLDKKYPKKGAALCWDGDNTIYATKGGSTWEFWAYDITGDAWVQKSNVPSPKKLKGGTSMAYKDGKIYFLAGGSKPADATNFYSYEPGADTIHGTPWIELTRAPLVPNSKVWKDGSCLALCGDYIYALKGGDKANYMFVYDIQGDTQLGLPWTQAESIPYVHPQIGKKTKVKDGGAMATDGSLIYAIKGAGKQDFWMYDPLAKGTWTPLDTIPRLWKKSVPKTGAGLAYLDGFVYLLKGNNTPEFWRYNATAEKSNTKTQMSNLSRDVIVNQSEAISNITPAINISPNPFTKNATIQYTVPVSGRVSIKLYNSIGRLVETLTDSHLSAGTYTMNLSANTLTKGIYFLKYEANNNKSELKLIVQ